MDHPTVRRDGAEGRRRASRAIASLAFAVLLLLFIYLLPRIPPVRSLIVNQVLSLVSNTGFDVTADSSSGDVWRGLVLRDVRAERRGFEAEVDRLELTYFSPALLRRQLPLSVTISGLSGDLDLETFEAPPAGSPPVQVQLRDLAVEDSSFAAERLPFTLPDFRLRDLRAQKRVDGLDLGLTLVTDDGSADLVATTKLAPLRIAANIDRADATLAKHWWRGVTGGVAAGELRYADGSFTADVNLAEGSLEFLNEEVTGITGPVRYGRNVVEARLSADTLGGELGASVNVDIPARQWNADATGNVQLAEVATWLATDRIPFDVSNLDITGAADVQLEASGWRQVSLQGMGRGAGSVLGEDLNALRSDFGFMSGEGARLQATAGLANGSVLATLTPQDGGFVFDLSAEDVSPQPWTSADLNFSMDNLGEGLSADGNLDVSVQQLGRDVSANVDLGLNAGVWQAELAGTDNLGETLQGTASFANGELESQISLQNVQLPGLSENPELVLAANGIPAELELNLALNADTPLTLDLPQISSSADLRGAVDATLAEGVLDFGGAFGPLALTGELGGDVSELRYALAPTQVNGLLSGQLGARSGRLDVSERAGAFDLVLNNVGAAGVGLPNTVAAVDFGFAEIPSASVSAPDIGLNANVVGDAVDASLNATPLSVVGQTLAVSGTALTANGLDGLELDLNATSPNVEADLAGNAENLALNLTAPYTQLTGNLNALEPAATLQGTLADLDLNAAASFVDGNLSADAELGGADGLSLSANGALDDLNAALTGSLDIGPVAERFDVNAMGVLNSDLRYDEGAFAGAAELDAELANVPLELTLTPQGDTLALSGEVRPFEQPLALSGSVLPLDVRATSDYGQLELTNTAGELTLSGAGETPLLERAGWQVAAQAWNLSADIAEREARLELGASTFSAALGAEGWTLSGDVQQRLSKANGASAELTGSVSASAENPAGSLDALLSVDTPDEPASSFSVTGSLDGVDINGNLSAQQAATLAGIPAALNGDISLDGFASPRELSYNANGVWQVDGEALEFTLNGNGSELSAAADADALALRYEAGELELNANNFDPAPFVGNLSPGSTLTGALSYVPTSQIWDGDVTLDLGIADGVTAQLEGAGDALLLDSRANGEAWSFAADGQVLPDLALELSATAAELAELNATLSGNPASPEISGRLTTQAITLSQGVSVSVPAQSFDLSSADTDALSLLLDGDNGSLSISPSALAGELVLPFELQGEPHSLNAELRGSPTQPDIAARVSGSLLEGPLNVSETGVRTRLELDPSPLLPILNDSALTLDASLAPDLTWQVDLSGGASYRDLPLVLSGKVEGAGAMFDAAGALRLNGEEIPFTAVRENGAVRADAQLESLTLDNLQAAVPVDVSGDLSGAVSFDTERADPFTFELSADGDAGGLPLDVDAGLRQGVFNLNANLLETYALVESSAPGMYDLQLYSSQAARPVSLEGSLQVAENYRLDAQGRVLDSAFEVSAAYAADTGDGQLQARFAEATLNADVNRNAQTGWQLSADLNDAAGELVGRPLNVSATAEANEGLRLNELELTTTVLDEPTELSLSGSVLPQTQLGGTLTSGELGALAVAVTEADAGYAAQLSQEGLELNAIASAGGLQALELTTAGSETVDKLVDKVAPGAEAELNGDLNWTADTGFAGELDVGLEAAGASADLAVTGAGALNIAGELSYAELVRGGLELNLNALTLADFGAADTLTGSLNLSADLAQTLASDAPLTFASELVIGGSPTNPTVAGPLLLDGAVNAAGELNVAGRSGNLSLVGDGLELLADSGEEGWQASFEAGLGLAELLPQLNDPRLNADVSAAQSWGQAPNIDTEVLELVLPESRLSAELTYTDSLQTALDVDLDLADVALAELSGEVTGQLALLSSGPGGALEVNALRLGERGERLDGTVLLNGTLAQPDLTVQLTGSEDASGTLLAILEPAQNRYSLSSNLALMGLRTNLDISSASGELSATGSLAYNDFALRVREGAGDTLTLEGQDDLEDWRLTLDVAERSAELTGSLATVVPNVSGELELRGSLRDALLSGTLNALTVAGIDVGDVRIGSTQTGGAQNRVQLSAETFDASVDVGERSVELNRLGLSLPSGLALTGTGAGGLAAGNFAFELLAEESRLPLQLSYDETGFVLAGENDFLQGDAAVFVEANDTGLQGNVKLENLLFAEASVSARAELSGELSAPRVKSDIDLAYQDAELTGSLVASRAGVSVDQSLNVPELAEALNVRGQLWPQPDAQLSYGADNLRIYTQTAATDAATDADTNTTTNTADTNTVEVLSAEGELALDYGPVSTVLAADPEGFLNVRVAANNERFSGLALTTSLPQSAPANFVSTLRGAGLTLQGDDALAGSINLSFSDGLVVTADNLAYRSLWGELELNGFVSRQDTWRAQLDGVWLGQYSPELPWLADLERVPFQAVLNDNGFSLSSSGGAGQLQAVYRANTGEGLLDANLTLGEGSLAASLAYSDTVGPRGELRVTNLPLGTDISELDARLELSPEAVQGVASLDIGDGRLSATGELGYAPFIPTRFAPQASDVRRLNLRADAVAANALPFLTTYAPELEADLSGIAQITGTRVVGRVLSPELSVADATLPLSVDFNGPPQNLTVGLSLGDSSFSGTLSEGALAGLFRFERFPIELIPEARVGDIGLESSLTARLRVELPFDDLSASAIRFASESIVLDNNGAITTGELGFSYLNGGLVVDQAEFVGENGGRWSAAGAATAEQLDLRLNADNANFSPLLSLVPQLAAFGVGASGDIELTTSGSLNAPQAELNSEALELSIASTSYRLEDSLLTVNGDDLSLSANLSGVAPVTGDLAITGRGEVSLSPLRPENLRIEFSGDSFIPILGEIEGVRGSITATPEEGWQLDSSARLDEAFSVLGSLAPLDLNVQGDNLNVRAPQYFLGSSSSDVNLNLRFENAFIVSGAINADSAQISTSGRERRTQTSRERREPNRALERVLFDDLRINAPQNVRLNENFGVAELGLDVTLSGSAAEPALNGRADARRGTFSFSGQDFSLDSAEAVFRPARGVYPTLDIQGRTSFTKTSVLDSDGRFDIIEPRSPTFDVILSLVGDITRQEIGPQPFSINLEPELSSPARVQDSQTGGAPRALSEGELYSLLTLGTLGLSDTLLGGGSVTENVAEGAIDTAVDFLILSSLQRELGDALGVDLLEIRTSSLSSLLIGEEEDFGVSFRIGGYLGEDLFASFQVANLNLESDELLRNEFSLRYVLEPVEFNLSSRLTFPRAGTEQNSLSPVPEIDLTVAYAFNSLVRLEAGVGLSQAEQSARFGVSFRW